ncbi:DUF6783 domain-containing protein [Robinsoniella sp. KNHs210]|uniref:DUF6783 domain-containing protein n=1 Tax=Robinsoniella sp. KNHs210 TaxID=1469950 RepID=UPI003FA6A6F2
MAFWQLCVTVCGRFVPDEGRVAVYKNLFSKRLAPTERDFYLTGFFTRNLPLTFENFTSISYNFYGGTRIILFQKLSSELPGLSALTNHNREVSFYEI